MEIQSAVFFRGRFSDYESTFETIGEPDYSAELVTDADVRWRKEKVGIRHVSIYSVLSSPACEGDEVLKSPHSRANHVTRNN